eukprot:3901402-Pleurochrysis_carterae.AAC.1
MYPRHRNTTRSPPIPTQSPRPLGSDEVWARTHSAIAKPPYSSPPERPANATSTYVAEGPVVHSLYLPNHPILRRESKRSAMTVMAGPLPNELRSRTTRPTAVGA